MHCLLIPLVDIENLLGEDSSVQVDRVLYLLWLFRQLDLRQKWENVIRIAIRICVVVHCLPLIYLDWFLFLNFALNFGTLQIDVAVFHRALSAFKPLSDLVFNSALVNTVVKNGPFRTAQKQQHIRAQRISSDVNLVVRAEASDRTDNLGQRVFDLGPELANQISVRVFLAFRFWFRDLFLGLPSFEIPMEPAQRFRLVPCQLELLDRNLVSVHFAARLNLRFDVQVVAATGETASQHGLEVVSAQSVACETELVVREFFLFLAGEEGARCATIAALLVLIAVVCSNVQGDQGVVPGDWGWRRLWHFTIFLRFFILLLLLVLNLFLIF